MIDPVSTNSKCKYMFSHQLWRGATPSTRQSAATSPTCSSSSPSGMCPFAAPGGFILLLLLFVSSAWWFFSATAETQTHKRSFHLGNIHNSTGEGAGCVRPEEFIFSKENNEGQIWLFEMWNLRLHPSATCRVQTETLM